MTTALSHGEHIEWFSNRAFFAAWELAFEQASRMPLAEEDRTEVDRFRQRICAGAIWNGIVVEIDDEFPNLASRRLWTQVFRSTAQAIFLREIGNQSDLGWQVDAVATLSRMRTFLGEAARSARLSDRDLRCDDDPVLESPRARKASRTAHICPCCGYPTIDEPDTCEVCPICDWEDDPLQTVDETFVGGVNHLSLRQAREAFDREQAKLLPLVMAGRTFEAIDFLRSARGWGLNRSKHAFEEWVRVRGPELYSSRIE
ncbi:CPCC family cysteine-rich protein [Chachezhania sediminis]|uniref:CPCC family cysteine-rich protein n=1 Tax=Chachezhania sediminis TaxID=2599291 RepID=UPI0018EF0179|nr:CPCC family cysteine-rich protein [Chachezhania sediminis]